MGWSNLGKLFRRPLISCLSEAEIPGIRQVGISINMMSGSPTPRDGVDSDFSGRDSAARIAGVLLILTAVITAVSAAGRVAADADQHTLAESLEAISLNTGLYGLGGATRLLAGIAL